MEHDDEVGGNDSPASGDAEQGPRRATFTPPSEYGAATPPYGVGTDDDALADALAADLGRLSSGPIMIVTPDTVIPPGPAMSPPVVPPVSWQPPVEEPHGASAAPVTDWSSFPAPDPAQAAPFSAEPPLRTSIPDDELSRWVTETSARPGGTLEVIEELQNQMRLREQESRELRAWEDRMRSLPTPAEPAAQPAPPAWDVPAPSASWSPPPEWGEAPAGPPPLISPEALAAAPAPAAATRAPFDWSPTGPIMSIPSSASTPPSTPVFVAPPDAVPSVIRPTVTAPPVTHDEAVMDDEAVVVPTIDPDADTVVEVEPHPELTVEALPDTGPQIFLPPPLVEPSPFGGPPLLPSQAKSSAPTAFDAALAGPSDMSGVGDDLDGAEPGAPVFDWTMPAPQAPPVAASPSAGPRVGLDSLSAEEPPPHHSDSDLTDSAPEALFIEPMPLAAGEGAPTDTGSITLVDQAYDEELDDDVDETDRVFAGLFGPVAVDGAGIAAIPSTIAPPSGPISTVRIPHDEQVLFDDEPIAQRVFSIEDSNLAPTPVDQRVGRAARLFWLWFAANSSILSLGLGAAVFAVGMSLRQSIVAILAGVAISFLPLGLTTLAGKRSGQPTMVVSRATFGLVGNVIPALLALVSRVFWGAVLLWLLASSIVVVLVGAQLDGPLGEQQILLISLAAAFLIAVLVAFAGYPLFARIQLILSIVSAILIVGLIVLTFQYIDIPQALTAADGPWLLTITGAVLVFSVVGLVWANSGADLARYQRTDSSGASSMLWATFGTTIPTFLLIAYGALLAASDEGIAKGFLLSPLDTLSLMLPSWYPVPLIAATALSLLSGVILSLYSGGFALQSIGVRVKRQWSIVIVGVLLGGMSLLLGFGLSGGLNEVLRDVATTLAVPTAAWAGIFAAETMIRNRRFEGESLVHRGGVYADVRWVNLIGLLVFSAVGFGFTTAAVTWLSWQGYGFTFFGIALSTDLAGTDLGVLVALALGLLLPIVAGIPAIRKQEATRV